MDALNIGDTCIEDSLFEEWCRLLERLIPGLQQVYFESSGHGPIAGKRIFTSPQLDPPPNNFARSAAQAIQNGAQISAQTTVADGEAPLTRIACPVHLASLNEAVVVIEAIIPLDRQLAMLSALKTAIDWLSHSLSGSMQTSFLPALEAVIDAGCHFDDYADIQLAVLETISDQLPCTRVVLGRSQNGSVHIVAVSGLSQLNPRNPRHLAVQQCMQQAHDRAATLSSSDQVLSPALENLLEVSGLAAVCAVPVYQNMPCPLVFLFEFSEHEDYQQDIIARCTSTARVASTLLEWRREQQQPWSSRFLSLCWQGLNQLFRPQGRMRRSLGLLCLASLGLFAIAPTDYQVTAPAVIEGAIQRAIVAPYDGFLEHAAVTAGQSVKAGQLLARLDDRELKEEERYLRAEAAELNKKHRQAITTLNKSEANILAARLEQSHSRLQLLGEKLQRIRLLAPFDAVIISGDWRRALGSPISRGDTLFELAPLDAYRVAVEVSDRDIASLAVGQPGEVILNALPSEPLPVSLTAISSIARGEQSEPAFRVETVPTGSIAALRPGMQGVARLSVGERPRWWIWTQGFTNWLRIQLWRWTP